MALSTSRWIAGALIGCALVPVIILRDVDSLRWEWEQTERDRLRLRAGRTSSQAMLAAERLYLLRLRDSVSAILAKDSRAGSRVLFDGSLDADTKNGAEELIRRAHPSTANARVAVDHIVLLDTTKTIRGAARRQFGYLAIDYLPPTPATGDRCAVLIRVDPTVIRNGERASGAGQLTSDVTRQRLMGPCAFYEQFGHPGPEISKWMSARGWKLALLGTWRDEPLTWMPPRWFKGRRDEYPIHEVMADVGVSCMRGDDDACLTGVLEAEFPRRDRSAFSGMISTADFNLFFRNEHARYATRWNFGPMEWTMLAEMARSLGPDRFAVFWRSDLPLADAFRSASGRSLAGWTRDWLERTYHEPRFGPTLATATVGMGLLLILLGAAIAIGASNRRQVG